MNIIGLSFFYHDSAAALVVDGQLTAAASEERFSRIKHDPELPKLAVEFCLKKANLTMDQIDRIVFYDKPMTKFDRILSGYMASPFLSYRPFVKAMPTWLRRKLWTEQIINDELEYAGEVLFLSHHLSHAAGAYYSSPFDEAAIVTIDGVGEWATASIGIGEKNKVRLIKQMNYPHSVGLLYSAITHYLGFRVNSSEYKVMGLAPYGEPKYTELMEQELLTIHDDGSIHLNMKYFKYHYTLRMTGKSMEQLFGQARRESDEPTEQFHKDIAASIQKVTEKIVLKMAAYAKEITGKNNICLSGGVALNCKANGELRKAKMFDEIYVQPAAGDAGGAMGAALYAHYDLTNDNKKTQPFFGVGSSLEKADVKQFLDTNAIPYLDGDQATQIDRLASALTNKKIIGMFQGCMEFGPRALGFRSILADARDAEMKEKINRAVKYREPFRPFAPVVIAEKATDYFEIEGDSPYMLFNFTVVPDKRAVIPAVTHIDNSSRIQTVARQDNPFLYHLLKQFEQKTTVAVLLNTSFNLRGHPIVQTAWEAMATFCSGDIDILYIEGFLIERDQLTDEMISRFQVVQEDD